MLSNLPNMLTILRLLAVFPLVYWLLTGAYQPALILAFIAGISDWVDGVLARRFGWTSRFGGVMDPLADKLMLVSLTLALAYIGEFPLWLALLIIFRDVVIVAGGVIYKYRFGPVDVAPFRLSKWNTGLVILLVLVVMLRLNGIQLNIAGQAIIPLLEDGLILLVTATTILSGIQYVWVWGAKAIGLHQSAKTKKDDRV
ncbi:MAG: CDP-alcohol phosphatidyltransferase family protein [Xanthomonadales bacterium]|nr:CDP-alcohol phosphatidyltransferase family protein [Xanthomonadales bacterium]